MESNFPTGYIIVVRGFLEWEWYEQPDVSRVMLHLMLKSNYTAKKWQGIEIGIGEFVTSTEKLSTALGISSFKIKNALKKLSDTGYIKIETTNKFTKIKLMESSVYQSKPFEKQKQTEQLATIKPKTTQKQTDTTNKNNKEKEIEESKNIFKTEIFKFLNSFPQDHLESFFNYWCQENKQTGRLKFEEEKFWNLEFKIKNWVNYPSTIAKSGVNKKFNKNRP
jgi:DNA-binding transcriptional MocR family regulator